MDPYPDNRVFSFWLFSILGIFWLSFSGCQNPVDQRPAQKGIIDLSSISFESCGAIALDGQWDFFPGQLLNPREVKKAPPSWKMYITQPTNWKGKNFNGKILDSYGQATYHIKIILGKSALERGDRFSILGLKIIEAHSAYKLWINDKLYYTQGSFSDSENSSKFSPYLKPSSVYFHPEQETLSVTINVQNCFDPKMGGIDDRVLIGSASAIIKDTQVKSFMFLVSFGILLVMGIFNLLISYVRKEEKASLYLGLVTLLLAVQAFWEGERTVFVFFPHFDTELYYKIWILTLNVFPLLAYFYHLLFPREITKKNVQISFFLFGLYSLIIVCFPYSVYGRILDYVLYIGLIISAYVFVKLVEAFLKKRQFAGLTLLGFLIPVIFAVNDILFGLDLIVTGYYAPVGFCLYIVFQSYVLSAKFAHSYEMARKLSGELKDLNENLELTVKERTVELNSANETLRNLNKEKDRLISIIAHDLRNPIGALKGLSEIITDPQESVTEEERKEYLMLIREGAEKSSQLLENLLQWAKLQTDDTEVVFSDFNLNELANDTIELLRLNAKEKNQTISMQIPDNLIAKADKYSTATILRNLISNAIKFTPENGNINVSASLINTTISVSVVDSGMGIMEKDLANLFRPGIKTSTPGTNNERGSGMGLVLCKELASRNGGDLCVKSKAGEGSIFTFTIKSGGKFNQDG